MLKRLLPILTLLFFIEPTIYAQNNSLDFDGTNDYVQTTFPGVLGTTPRTFEAWIKLPSAPNGNKCITDYGRNAVGSRNTFVVTGSGFLGYISGGTNANITATGATVPIGSWVHVAFVYDGTNGFLYQNGTQVGTGLLTTVNTPSGFTNFRIGQRVPGGSIPFPGNIDEVRIWNVAKSGAEIAASMNTELTGNESNLMFYTKMDDDMASCDVVDCTASENHGSRIGGTLFSSDVPAITDADCAICMTNCALGICSISAISVSNISPCDDNGTDMDPSDDTFTADVTVDFMGEPASGNLSIGGDGAASVPVGSLSGCSHTFTGVTMSADGNDISITANFTANTGCSLINSNAGTAPASCSNAQPPAQCSISSIISSNISACNDNGTPNIISDDTFTADVTVTFADAPASGTLDLTGDGTASVDVGSIGTTTHTFTGLTMTADGTPIALTATFSADAACTLSSSNTGQAPNQCSVNVPPGAIPTMSEWGLILFALIIFTFSVVMGTQHQQKLAMSGNNTITGTGRQWMFDKATFLKVLPFVYLGFVLIFATAISLFGYELTNADIPGSLLSGLVVAYLVQFVMKSSESNN